MQRPSELPTAIAPSPTWSRGGVREAIELGQDRVLAERARRSEPRQVEGDRAPAFTRQTVEHEPPGVGRVGEAVEEKMGRTLAVELQHPGLVARENEPMLEQRFHPPCVIAFDPL